MPSKHLILCHPLLLPQSFLASGSFPVSQFFTSGGQSTGASASASVLPMNIQGWFPLGLTFCFVFLELTGLILQSKDLSRVFSSTTVWKHQFFRTQPSLWFSSHILTILKVISSIVWLQALTIPVMLSKFKTSLLKGGKAVLIGALLMIVKEIFLEAISLPDFPRVSTGYNIVSLHLMHVDFQLCW